MNRDHQEQGLFIGGSWSPPSTDQVIEVTSPHTESVVASVPAAGPADIDAAVAAARFAFDDGPWPRAAPSERLDAMRRLTKLYGERKSEMAQAISTELGAPITFAQRAQVGLPLMMMGAFCDVAEGYPWQEIRPGFFGSDLHIRHEPVGVVAAVVPWNMHQFLIASKLVPCSPAAASC